MVTNIYARTPDEACAALAQINWFVVAIDTETNFIDENNRYDNLVGKGYSVSDGRTVVYVDLFDQPQGCKVLGEFLKRTNTIIGHNIIYDAKILHKYGVDIRDKEWFDTMVAQHLIDEESEKGLKVLAKKYLDVEETMSFKDAVKDGYHTEKFYQYASNDALWTWQLAHVLKNKLQEDEVVDLFRNVEMPFLKVLMDMEMNGILVDQEKVKTITAQLKTELLNTTKKMYEILGTPYSLQHTIFGEPSIVGSINFNSPAQLAEILHGKLGLPVIQRSKKTDAPSAGKVTMAALKGKHEFVTELEKYKIISKLLSAFFDPMPAMIENDGRVRPHFKDTGTVTGRLSCQSPNIQQLPKVNEAFPVNTRSCFIASPGKTLIAADYSQQELRIMTELSQDANLIRILNNKGDLHLINANLVFNLGIPEEKLYEEHPEYRSIRKEYAKDRDKGKVFSFGIPYGMGAHKLSRDFDVTVEEAEVLLGNFFKGFPELESAIQKTHETVAQELSVRTFAGRKRHFREDDRGQVDFKSLRQSFNFLIQSYGADLIRMACIKVYDYAQKHPEYGIKLLITVHDEIVLECYDEYAKQVSEDTVELMKSCANMVVPLVAEASLAKDYGSAK